MAVYGLPKFQKSISQKVLVTVKTCNFDTVLRHLDFYVKSILGIFEVLKMPFYRPGHANLDYPRMAQCGNFMTFLFLSLFL